MASTILRLFVLGCCCRLDAAATAATAAAAAPTANTTKLACDLSAVLQSPDLCLAVSESLGSMNGHTGEAELSATPAGLYQSPEARVAPLTGSSALRARLPHNNDGCQIEYPVSFAEYDAATNIHRFLDPSCHNSSFTTCIPNHVL